MADRALQNVKGFLFDLDGVFHVGSSIVPGAVETIEYLRFNNIPYRFTTNTSTRSRESLQRKLNGIGVPLRGEEIISSPYAAVLYLRQRSNPRCCFVLADDVRSDFAEFESDEVNPEAIVLGDVGDKWNYDLLNRLFGMMMNGAELIALHKGRYWQVEDGLRMDIGAFVAGLEYVTGKQATIIGKPSRSFFELALQELGLPAEDVAMIGDDIISDVGGAQDAGLKGILVKTGKYRPDVVSHSPVTPDLILDSIGKLPHYM